MNPATRCSDTRSTVPRLAPKERSRADQLATGPCLRLRLAHIGNWLPRSWALVIGTGRIDRRPELPVTRDSPSRVADDDRSAVVDPFRVHGTHTPAAVIGIARCDPRGSLNRSGRFGEGSQNAADRTDGCSRGLLSSPLLSSPFLSSRVRALARTWRVPSSASRIAG